MCTVFGSLVWAFGPAVISANPARDFGKRSNTLCCFLIIDLRLIQVPDLGLLRSGAQGLSPVITP